MGWGASIIDYPYAEKYGKVAKEEQLLDILLLATPRWTCSRIFLLRKCSVTGKWIWPFEKAWLGIVYIKPLGYRFIWVSDDQYLIQKLKGLA